MDGPKHELMSTGISQPANVNIFIGGRILQPGLHTGDGLGTPPLLGTCTRLAASMQPKCQAEDTPLAQMHIPCIGGCTRVPGPGASMSLTASNYTSHLHRATWAVDAGQATIQPPWQQVAGATSPVASLSVQPAAAARWPLCCSLADCPDVAPHSQLAPYHLKAVVF
jgi:hypothetical protein